MSNAEGVVRSKSKEEYFAHLKDFIFINYFSTFHNRTRLSPMAELERSGNVYRFPGGGALTYRETNQDLPDKVRLIIEEINKGETVHLRGHAQMEYDPLQRLYESKDAQIGDTIQIAHSELTYFLNAEYLIGKKDSTSNVFEYKGAYHCGGSQGFGPIGGVQGALQQSSETIDRLVAHFGQDAIHQMFVEGKLTAGIELPGNLTIYLHPENIGKRKKEKKYSIGPDKEKTQALNGNNSGKWFECVDEKVGGGELPELKIGPGSVFPHATVTIGIADSNDEQARIFAASLENLRLIDPRGNMEFTSAGLRFIMPEINNLTGNQAREFAGNVVTLWELICTEMLPHSGTSGGRWQIGLSNSSSRLELYRPGAWEQMKNFLSFHHGTLAVAALQGSLPDETKTVLKKKKIPLLEIPRLSL